MLVDVTAPLGALGLDASPGLPARTTVEFERTVAAGGAAYLRIDGTDVAAVVAALRGSPHVADVAPVDDPEIAGVYRLTWGDAPALFRAVTGVDGAVVAARAADGGWTFTLRFPSRDAASRFVERHDGDPPVTVEQIHRTDRLRTRGLTAEQHVALRRAVDAGYFAVPRRATLSDLADDLGISDTAASQRLRRGLATVLPAVVDPNRGLGRADDD
ncbi:MAG: helix-turn-helix domain-containing protein [Haloferacaceae archaeon]